METTLKSPSSNEKKSLTSGKNTSHRGNDAQCPTFPSRQTVVQAKLELTTPGDSYEQEADRMADHVMRSAFSVSDGDGQGPRQTMSRPIVSRRSSGSGGVAVDSQTESGIMSSRGGGSSLPTALRSRMETGFGADFSNVRIHNDATAASLSNSIQAKAFTYGNDIYFNRGQYSPSSSDGQRLIAHELTHTLQQTGKVGRENDGDQENQEIKNFKEMSLDLIVNYRTNNPNLQKIIEFANIIATSSPNIKSFCKSFNININTNNSYFILKGKHFLYFFDKYLNASDKGYSYTISDVENFINYADFIYKGVEDKWYVHGSMQQKSIDNYANERRNDGKGITIAIITDEDMDDNNAAKGTHYLDKNDKGLYEKDDYFYVLQGLDSFDDYINNIKSLVEKYGPLQNLIISGHGNWDIMGLGNGLLLKFNLLYIGGNKKDYERRLKIQADTIKFFTDIKDIMGESRKELGNNKQSIFLESCLTNSLMFREYENFAKSLQNIVGNDVKLFAAEVSIDQSDYSIDYDNTDNSLNVIWNTDYSYKEIIELGNQFLFTYSKDLNFIGPFVRTVQNYMNAPDTPEIIYLCIANIISIMLRYVDFKKGDRGSVYDSYYSQIYDLKLFGIFIRQAFYNVKYFVNSVMKWNDLSKEVDEYTRLIIPEKMKYLFSKSLYEAHFWYQYKIPNICIME